MLEKPNNTFADADGDFVVGRDPKYHSGAAWKKGYEMYKDYGAKNGMYFTATQEEELNRKAELARKEFGLSRDACRPARGGGQRRTW